MIIFVHMSLHCQTVKRDKVLSKAVKKIWSVVTTILVVLAVLLAVALVGVRVVGYTPYTILSGSMDKKVLTNRRTGMQAPCCAPLRFLLWK